jgi:hypothetical protein
MYDDCPNNIFTELKNFSTDIKIHGNTTKADGDIDIFIDNLNYKSSESDTSYINFTCNKLQLHLAGKLDNNIIEGTLKLNLPQTDLDMDSTKYLNSNDISIDLPFAYNFDNQYVDIKGLKLNFEKNIISLKGTAQLNYNDTDDVLVNVNFNTSKLVIDQIINYIPKEITSYFDEYKIEGNVTLEGSVNGIYNEKTMPKIILALLFEEGKCYYPELDYQLTDVYAKLIANVDISDEVKYNAHIDKLSAKTMKSTFEISGIVWDTANDINCDLKLKANINLPDTYNAIPDDLNVKMTGMANITADAKF